eukprot:353268-Chlamydomonas_euryale.AAC.3
MSAPRPADTPCELCCFCFCSNKAKALRVLRARLYDGQRRAAADFVSGARRAAIGSGDRSERVRTYNFPQNRLTDHRVAVTLHALEDLAAGGAAGMAALDSIGDALAMKLRTEQLEELACEDTA